MNRIIKTIVKGLTVTLPVALTIYVVIWLGKGAESLLAGLVPENLYVPGMGILTGLALVFVIGLMVNLWVVRWFIGLGEALLEKIPLVKTIYGGIRDMMSFFPSGDKQKGMNKVVMLTFQNTRLMGFVTREDFNELPGGIARDDDIAVYLPMSYQIGGFTVFVPRSMIEPVDLTVEEGMRFAITAGMSTEKQESPLDMGPEGKKGEA